MNKEALLPINNNKHLLKVTFAQFLLFNHNSIHLTPYRLNGNQ